MAHPKLGRRHVPDERDNLYPMRLMLDPLAAQFFPTGVAPGHRFYNPGPILDQKETGTCVAFGTTGKINDAPFMQSLPAGMTPYDLYRLIVTLDEFTDNDQEANLPDDELQLGTSARAGCKAGVRLGFFKSYLKASSAADVRAWMLAGLGGVLFGLNWSDGMFETDADGFLRPTGQIQGGHCIRSTGWNDFVKLKSGKTVAAVRIQNNWGSDWGQHGRAWIAADDLDRLIHEDGEAWAPTEQKVLPLPHPTA